MTLEDIRGERIKKLETLRASGHDPFPADVNEGMPIAAVLKNFSKIARRKKPITVVGRLFAKRGHGGSTFADIRRGDEKLQLFFSEDALGEAYRLFSDTVDVGDFLEIAGTPFTTKRGEPTLAVSRWRMLAKSLRPLPEKWRGLQDVEERFRKRYLDMLMNDDVRQRFYTRSFLVRTIRTFFDKTGFNEFETPILQTVAGGALARPFKTHHHALDIDLYLRIAKELFLKRLLVGGLERIYEIGRDFRNEGIDATHNPEFTMLEAYAAWWGEDKMMQCVEKLFGTVVGQLTREGLMTGAKEFEYDKKKIVAKTPFPRISFLDLLRQHALIVDYDGETRDSMALRASRFGIETASHESRGKIADGIFKKICRPHIINPTFVVNHPLDISPLAKKIEKDSHYVRRFQLVVAGLEIANGFAELNDPLDQQGRFEDQQKMRAGGEEDAHPLDESFIEAMEYGMPPAAGVGIGIDRLVMLFTDMHTIKEVIAFPTMRPK